MFLSFNEEQRNVALSLIGTDAFILGFSVGRKTRRYWSAREALAAYPGVDHEAFLNGTDDGARGDVWRLNMLRAPGKVVIA